MISVNFPLRSVAYVCLQTDRSTEHIGFCTVTAALPGSEDHSWLPSLQVPSKRLDQVVPAQYSAILPT